LIQLDSTVVQERLLDYRGRYETYAARQIQADAQLKARQVQNATRLADAEQDVELAELSEKMYYDNEGGTYLLAVQAQQIRIREAKAKVSEVQAALALQETQSRAVKLLHDLGYRSRQDVVRAEFNTLKNANDLAAAVNLLDNAQAAGRQLEHFEHPIQQLKLRRATEQTRARLEQVKLDNYAELIQAESGTSCSCTRPSSRRARSAPRTRAWWSTPPKTECRASAKARSCISARSCSRCPSSRGCRSRP
jgi:hypothetical protein